MAFLSHFFGGSANCTEGAGESAAGLSLDGEIQSLIRIHLGGMSPPFFDTLMASRLLEAGEIRSGFKLAQVVERQLGFLLDKQMQTSDWEAPALAEEQLLYAAR